MPFLFDICVLLMPHGFRMIISSSIDLKWFSVQINLFYFRSRHTGKILVLWQVLSGNGCLVRAFSTSYLELTILHNIYLIFLLNPNKISYEHRLMWISVFNKWFTQVIMVENAYLIKSEQFARTLLNTFCLLHSCDVNIVTEYRGESLFVRFVFIKSIDWYPYLFTRYFKANWRHITLFQSPNTVITKPMNSQTLRALILRFFQTYVDSAWQYLMYT